ncbi:MAG: transporter associated domain-containing protein [Desulfomonilia bacterium]
MMPLSDMEFLPIDVSFEDIRKTIAAKNYSRYPVYEGERDNIVGYLHIRDLWRYVDNPEPSRSGTACARPTSSRRTKPSSSRLIDSSRCTCTSPSSWTNTHGQGRHHARGHHRGDHRRHHRRARHHPGPCHPGGGAELHHHGNISLRDLGRYIDREFPEEYDTLSGLIYELLDRIPEEGDKVTWQDIAVRIERMRETASHASASRSSKKRK